MSTLKGFHSASTNNRVSRCSERARVGVSYPLDWRRWSTGGRTPVRHRAGTCNCRQWTLPPLRTRHPKKCFKWQASQIVSVLGGKLEQRRDTGSGWEREEILETTVKMETNNRKGYLGCLSGSCSFRSSGEMSYKKTHTHTPEFSLRLYWEEQFIPFSSGFVQIRAFSFKCNIKSLTLMSLSQDANTGTQCIIML